MNDSRFQELKEFISDQAGVYEQDVTHEARLYEDLGIYGDDAVELLVNYGKRFNVDVSHFMAADYFKGEGMDIIGGLIKLIDGKPSSTGSKVLTVRDLENGILAGRLDEEVIAGSSDTP